MISSTVGHYRIAEKIGEGGMGEVYRAEDLRLHRTVALKFLPTQLQEDEVARKRFLREARSAAALEHPYICNIKEVNRTGDGRDFIVMEYVEGQTLRERLERGGPLPLDETLRISSEIAEALQAAHARGLVHRDLKPDNIMLTPQGHAKVMDFGLAKRVTGDDETQQDLTSAVTRSGVVPGTPAYMSPEQIQAQPVDSRSDLFSVGIVPHEMLTGANPFRRSTAAATLASILYEEPEPLPRNLAGSSDLLDETLGRLLAKDPDKRMPSSGELRRRPVGREPGPRTPS